MAARVAGCPQRERRKKKPVLSVWVEAHLVSGDYGRLLREQLYKIGL
jgi:hypothetical protein